MTGPGVTVGSSGRRSGWRAGLLRDSPCSGSALAMGGGASCAAGALEGKALRSFFGCFGLRAYSVFYPRDANSCIRVHGGGVESLRINALARLMENISCTCWKAIGAGMTRSPCNKKQHRSRLIPRL